MPSAHAQTYRINGDTGTTGTAGTDGAPPTDGSTGGAGESITINSIGVGDPLYPADPNLPEDVYDISYWLYPIMGAGGTGGAGGNATSGDTDGGAGGDGGVGGESHVTVDQRGNEVGTRINSRAGSGGAGGAGGAGSGTGSAGASGDGGNGGLATATGYADTAALMWVSSDGGTGGSAGDGGDGGQGGDAFAYAENTGGRAQASAGSGSGGNSTDGIAGDGGYAEARAVGLTDPVSGDSSVSAFAGHGGSTVSGTGGDGGDAFAEIGPEGITPGSGVGGSRAIGGNGGNVTGFTPGTVSGQGGNGGNAYASSTSARAEGGDAGDGFTALPGLAGTGTAVSNFITATESDTALTIAFGGEGGDATGSGNQGSAGGQATATTTMYNGEGSATAQAGSGGQGYTSARGGDGGDSEATLNCSDCGANNFVKAGTSQAGLEDDSYYSFGRTAANWKGEQVYSGGNGGAANRGRGGAGGDATAVANMQTTKAEPTGRLESRITVNAIAGDGGNQLGTRGYGGAGGTASATATISDTTLDDSGLMERAQVYARGGDGGNSIGAGRTGGHGGGSSVSVTAISSAATTDNVWLFGQAMGGYGGDGLNGANGGNGASISLNNAVSAAGSNVDYLKQVASGGNAGSSWGGLTGIAGDASSVLNHTQTGTDDLLVRAEAWGGDGGEGTNGSAGGAGGAASGSVSATGGGNVAAELFIGTGNGGIGRSAGTSAADGTDINSVGTVVNAVSTGGGEVTATMQAGDDYHGDGGYGYNGAKAGNGASVSVIDAVDAQTTGAITLFQKAQAGDSGRAYDTGAGGDGGDAYSELTRSYSTSGGVTVDVEADGGTAYWYGNRGGKNGRAEVRTDVHNDSGAATVTGYARNGEKQASTTDQIAKYEDSIAVVTASTAGDGNDARATATARSSFNHEYNTEAPDGVTGTRGSDGVATATATTEGTSASYATARADSGKGDYMQGANPAASLSGADGNATATANAINTGTGYVEAYALANSYRHQIYNADQVSAADSALKTITATANATGNAGVKATSESSLNERGVGISTARSNATGASGVAESVASSSSLQHLTEDQAWVRARANATVNGTPTSVQSRVASGVGLDTMAWDQSLRTQASALNLPDQAEIAAIVAAKDESSSIFAPQGNENSEYLTYASMGMTHSGAIGVETYETQVDASYHEMLFNENDHLMLAFLGAESIGAGFDSLDFYIELWNGTSGGFVEDQLVFSFTDVAEAMAFFSDTLLDLGQLEYDDYYAESRMLFFRMDMTMSGAGDGFAIDFTTANAQVVPIPAAVWMFGSALAFLGWRRKKTTLH